MKIISSDEELRRYVPNVFATVKGEGSFYDKITPFLDQAEKWAVEAFTSRAIFDTICGMSEAHVIRTHLSRVVVCEAFRNAAPSLDLVLTPNGFGIVSNQNVVPASRERVERLIASLEMERDGAIHLLLAALPSITEWFSTEQCSFFAATMFPNTDICSAVGIREHRWEKYLELRPILQTIEQHIATQFIGEEQMVVFRKAVMQPSFASHAVVKSVIGSLRAVEVQMLRTHLSPSSPPLPPTHLVQIVDVIIKHPDEFPEWHGSPIADLYSPPIFNNEKHSTGYWF